jgi:hypothetical protein
MAKSKLKFTENEVRRAIRAVQKMGIGVGRVLVDRDGNISVIAAGDGDTTPPRKKVDRRAPKLGAVS